MHRQKRKLQTAGRRPTTRFVFVCVPAGYDAPVEKGVVRYFHPLPADGKSCDFTLLRRAGDDSRYGFIAIADPQIWAPKEFAKLAAAADDIAATVRSYGGMPFHGICCGDIVSHDHSLYGRYNEVMERTGITFRNAMGNHDMKVYGRSYETSFSKFEQMYGPVYYSFDVGRIHYVVLDDNFFIGRDYFYIGYLEERQMRWLEKDLARVQPGSTVVVCLHIPSTCEEQDRKQFRYDRAGSTMTNHRGLYEILKPYRAHIISGHTHTTFNQPIAPGLYEHVTPALSGAWWQGPLCTDGTPAGYGVYEVNGRPDRLVLQIDGLSGRLPDENLQRSRISPVRRVCRGQRLGQRPGVGGSVYDRRRAVRSRRAVSGLRSRRETDVLRYQSDGPQMDLPFDFGPLLPRRAARRGEARRGVGYGPLRADQSGRSRFEINDRI